MTNEELISKIKAEIERQMKFYYEKEMKAWGDSEQGDEDALWYQGHRKMCAKLLTFLSTLESEKPMEHNIELNDEIYKEKAKIASLIGGVTGVQDRALIDYANHFTQWGKEQGYREGFLEGTKIQREEDDQLVDTIYQQGIEKGKDDMKEQAVSGTLAYEPHLRRIIVNLDDIPDGAWNGGGTPVEVIIFKKEQATKEVN